MSADFEKIWPHVNSVQGFLSSPCQEEWLYHAAKEIAGVEDMGNILEVGSFMGRSTSCLAFACMCTKCRVHVVDLFHLDAHTDLPKEYENIFRANMERLGLTEYIQIHRGRSSEFGQFDFGRIGMLFIDASHEYEDVKSDFYMYSRHVCTGGWIVLHDVFSHEGPTRLWNEVKNTLTNPGACGNMAFGRKTKD